MDRGEQIALKLSATVEARGNEYGEVTRNFQRIASLWTAYLHNSDRQVVVTPEDIAPMMMLLKIARMQNPSGQDDFDTLLDIAGYAVCHARVTSG